MSLRPDRTVAGFDSATAMVRALSRYLRGTDVPLAGQRSGRSERVLAPIMGWANQWPASLKQHTYAITGWREAIPRRAVPSVDAGTLARWVCSHYPPKETNVAFIGSANGALVHLAAALEAPWLPQTLLIPVRRFGVPAEDGARDLAQMRAVGEELVEANPDWVLHHMHDPNQDRLMIRGMCYFRPKWRRLPEAYRTYLRAVLSRNATLVVSDCGLRWPTTRVNHRYVFQHGGFGGATVEELQEGGERVRRYLSSYGSRYSAWLGPSPDTESPEAEWGFEPELLTDLRELAREEGWRLLRLRYPEPGALSPAVADLYRAWYHDRGIDTRRLLVESFMLVEPYWTLRTGSVPFWMVFNEETSLAAVERYLDTVPAYSAIRLSLFSHGVESVGLVPADRWRAVLDYAASTGDFLGTDPRMFPRDFAVFARMHQEISHLTPRFPLPGALDWASVAEFLRRRENLQLVTEHDPG